MKRRGGGGGRRGRSWDTCLDALPGTGRARDIDAIAFLDRARPPFPPAGCGKKGNRRAAEGFPRLFGPGTLDNIR
ncbi:hypothetical protein SAMN03159494_01817 [Achromobacter sp. NFACC18-2]|nr:hypothetical protein SAMN03159494_01817 [Achromobacter sp. NFACC18-2]